MSQNKYWPNWFFFSKHPTEYNRTVQITWRINLFSLFLNIKGVSSAFFPSSTSSSYFFRSDVKNTWKHTIYIYVCIFIVYVNTFGTLKSFIGHSHLFYGWIVNSNFTSLDICPLNYNKANISLTLSRSIAENQQKKYTQKAWKKSEWTNGRSINDVDDGHQINE